MLSEFSPFDEVPITNVDSKIHSKTLPLNNSLRSNSASSHELNETLSVSSIAESEEQECIKESTLIQKGLKYSYKENQWSPLNPEEKRQYDRDFLLQLQTVPLSMRKPLKLPNLDIIKDKPHIQKLKDIKSSEIVSFRDDFLPICTNKVKEKPQRLTFNNSLATVVDGEMFSEFSLFDEVPITNVDSKIHSKTLPLNNSLRSNSASSHELNETSSVSSIAESEEQECIKESTLNQKGLKYSYKENQWSPLNPEGKKQYDRDFLLQLQTVPLSMRKPFQLPNLDIIKDKPHIQKLKDIKSSEIVSFRDDFLPFCTNKTVIKKKKRRSLQENESETKTVLPLQQYVKLHEAEEPWKPAFKQEIPLTEEETLKRSIQAILNKLTQQKFETLLTQFKGLNVDTVEKLTIVADFIFENAINSFNFLVLYGNLCKHLKMIIVPTKDGKFINFRKLLLTKCQKEFEENQIKMEVLEVTDPVEKIMLKQKMDEKERKIKYRKLGNIRFIGELFKVGMLIKLIMDKMVEELLLKGDELSLECLCCHLKTIGKILYYTDKKTKDNMESHFTKMQEVVDRRLISCRIRFMLQDIIDLKKNNWVLRRIGNCPETIDKIHKEDKARHQITYEEDWTFSTKSSKVNYSIIDPRKLLLTEPYEDDSIRIEPKRTMQSLGRGRMKETETQACSDTDKTTLSEGSAAQLPNIKNITKRKTTITDLVKALQRGENIKKTHHKKSCNSRLNVKETGSAGSELNEEQMKNKSESVTHEVLRIRNRFAD